MMRRKRKRKMIIRMIILIIIEDGTKTTAVLLLLTTTNNNNNTNTNSSNKEINKNKSNNKSDRRTQDRLPAPPQPRGISPPPHQPHLGAYEMSAEPPIHPTLLPLKEIYGTSSPSHWRVLWESHKSTVYVVAFPCGKILKDLPEEGVKGWPLVSTPTDPVFKNYARDSSLKMNGYNWM